MVYSRKKSLFFTILHIFNEFWQEFAYFALPCILLPKQSGAGGGHNSQNCIKTAKVSSDTRLIWTFFRIPQKIDTARFRWPKTRLKNRKNLAGKHCKSHVACAYPTEVYRKNTHKNPAFWRYRSRMDDKWLKNQKKTIRKKKSTETGGAQDGCVKPTEKNTNILSETCCMTFFFEPE